MEVVWREVQWCNYLLQLSCFMLYCLLKYSVLDLAPVNEGEEPSAAFRNSLALAQLAEKMGFNRYWLAEHHNMPGIASAATSVVIGHIASGTSRIRVGAGGVMLPNHSPLVIAEQYGTLESLYPGRIDLGLGRAPGSDAHTARALRRDFPLASEKFPQDVQELISLFAAAEDGQQLQAVPGAGLNIPIWILGSSVFGAHLAAIFGLPFAFASHFAPEMMEKALDTYRSKFEPSERLAEPYAMAGLNFFAADTDTEATVLFTSLQKQFVNLFRGSPGKLQAPVESLDGYWSSAEREGVQRALRHAVVGKYETVAEQVEEFLELTQVDELILSSQIYDQNARCYSYQIAGEVCGDLLAS
jgi:luciferase family oxidoreductase group 1